LRWGRSATVFDLLLQRGYKIEAPAEVENA
jgi:hypothetical protein